MSKKEKVVLQCSNCCTHYDEMNPGFFVVEVKKKKPWKVFYDLHELKFEIYRWTGEPLTPYAGPPEPRDIEEGLKKGIIDQKEANELKRTDWAGIEKKMFVEGFLEKEPVDLNDEQMRALDLYFQVVHLKNFQHKESMQ